MNEFETYEAMMMTLDMAVTASMNFVALLFAYLVAAFVVGKSLPRGVAIGTSVSYSLFLVPPFSGTVQNLTRAYDGGRHMQVHYPDSWAFPGDPASAEWLVFMFAVPMLIGWLGSLYYMHLFVRGSTRAS